jgi:hypothetical protein
MSISIVMKFRVVLIHTKLLPQDTSSYSLSEMVRVEHYRVVVAFSRDKMKET